MNKFSICIPTYEMGGYGHEFLDQLLHELKQQTVQDFEVVISDQSIDNKVLEVCQQHAFTMNIVYFKSFYNKGKAACNINKAMQYASGEIIKILYQDDFFVDADALSKIAKAFDDGSCVNPLNKKKGTMARSARIEANTKAEVEDRGSTPDEPAMIPPNIGPNVCTIEVENEK